MFEGGSAFWGNYTLFDVVFKGFLNIFGKVIREEFLELFQIGIAQNFAFGLVGLVKNSLNAVHALVGLDFGLKRVSVGDGKEFREELLGGV